MDVAAAVPPSRSECATGRHRPPPQSRGPCLREWLRVNTRTPTPVTRGSGRDDCGHAATLLNQVMVVPKVVILVVRIVVILIARQDSSGGRFAPERARPRDPQAATGGRGEPPAPAHG